MNIFKHKCFWLVIILVVLLGIFLTTQIHVERTVLMKMAPSSVYFDLKPEELNSLKKDALEKRDAKAAWRISAYYSTTKEDFVEGKKWEKIAREIQSTTRTNLNPVLSNNSSDGK